MFANQKEIEIEGTKYHIHLLKARTGFNVSIELSKIFLPLLGQTFDASRHDDVFHGAPKTFTDMAMILCSQMDKVNVEEIIFDKLLKDLIVNGQVCTDIDSVFRGKYDVLFELVAFAIKENFGSLFAGKGLLSRFQEVVTNISSPT